MLTQYCKIKKVIAEGEETKCDWIFHILCVLT